MVFFEKFKALSPTWPIEQSYTKLSIRLPDPLICLNTCGSILKTFLINKKFLACLLFFMERNSSQTLKKKLNYLIIFSKINTPLWEYNCSVLPADAPHLTYKRLDSLIFLSCDIAKIISHIGHDIAQSYSSVSEWGNYVEIQFIILFQ